MYKAARRRISISRSRICLNEEHGYAHNPNSRHPFTAGIGLNGRSRQQVDLPVVAGDLLDGLCANGLLVQMPELRR